jgi:hypothetical protein
MRKFIFIILLLFAVVSCKKDLVKKPDQLIEKGKMIDIMYDLSLLEVIRYHGRIPLDSFENSQAKFMLQKYKVDSLQFLKSNMYYAADYKNYKGMFDEVQKRLEKDKAAIDSLLKKEERKAEKEKKQIKKDSIEKSIKKVNNDSIKKRIQLKK